MNKRIVRRAITAVLLVGAAVVALAGCGASATIVVSAPLTLPLHNPPQWVEISPDGGRVLVSTYEKIEVLDARTLARLGAYGASSAGPPALAPDGQRAYVTSSSGLEAIDLVGGLVLDPLVADAGPFSTIVGISGDGARLFGYNPGSPSVLAEVDLRTGTVRPVAPVASSVAVLPDGSRAYTAPPDRNGRLDALLHVIDVATGAVSEVPGTEGSLEVALGPGGRTVYAIGFAGVVVIDAGTGTVTTRARTSLISGNLAAVSPDGEHLFVTDATDEAVEVIARDSGEVVTSVPITDVPRDLALTPDGRRLFVASTAGLTIVDLAART
jgi:DNA-binding beta-propeller fold protein YncE